MGMTDKVAEVHDVVESIRPLLAGRDSPVVGSVLSELMAIWVVTHVHVDDPEQTRILRDMLITMHVDHTRDILPLIEEREHEARSNDAST